MGISPQDTAFVVTDPQNDVLSEKGAAWGLVGAGIQQIGTVEYLDQLFSAAKTNGYDVVISPHYYYPTDQGWRFGGPVEQMMHEMTHINDHPVADTLTGPFGGEKNRGIGRLGGEWIIREFTRDQWVTSRHQSAPYPSPFTRGGGVRDDA